MIQPIAIGALALAVTVAPPALAGTPASLSLGEAQEPAASVEGPNVLLVTLEAVRTDRLGCYGRAESVTPRLDGLASEGATFERAYAHAPLVLPACASVITGVTPLAHGLHEDARLALGPELPTLAETFQGRGYQTVAFLGSLELDGSFGLTRGFDVYDDEMGAPEDMKALARERRARFVVGAFLEWAKGAGDEPYFAWLHLPDARFPYEPPVDLRSVPDAYDGELAALDRELGRLLDGLKEAGTLDETIVVVVGAMGEALGEQGENTHGLLLQESVVRVPLVVRLPGEAEDGRRVATPVGQSDLMPTILTLSGAPAVEHAQEYAPFEGRSVAKLVDSADADLAAHDVYLESEVAARQLGWSTMRGLVRGDHKLVVGSSASLYDVAADASEAQDLAESEAELVGSMGEALNALLAASAELQPQVTHARGRYSDRMAAIAYSLPDALHGRPLPERGAVDPRASTTAWNAYQDTYQTSWSGSPHLISGPLERAVEASPDTAMLNALMAVALERTRRFEEAVTRLQVAVEIDPELAMAYYYLGRSCTSLGRPGEAESNYLIAIEIDPAHELAHRALGRRLASEQRLAEARPHFAALTALRPDDRMIWMGLVHIDRTAGDWALLSETLAGAVANFPDDLYLRNFQAWVFATAPVAEVRDPERAIAIAEALAQETERNDPGILDTLAAAYASAGRYDEAKRTVGLGITLGVQRKLNDLVADMRARLALYGQETPYFDK